jgi:FdhE protein
VTAAATALAGLKRDRPEWLPWLGVIEETLREINATTWATALPHDPPAAQAGVPLLSGATLTIQPDVVRSVFQRLTRTASHSGTTEMASLKSAVDVDVDPLELLRGSLCFDSAAARDVAASSGANAVALEAVIALLAVPFLHTCNRRWAGALPVGWVEGYCPLCGAWPAFAEARGIERNRFFRCGRCGGEWHARPLRCPFCSADDHNALASLVPENAGLNAVIEGCQSCSGYMKTFTRLQGCPAAAVMLDDLATVHLDLAALEQGYARPQGAGHSLDLEIRAGSPPSKTGWRFSIRKA